MTSAIDSRFLLLDPRDNVLVCRKAVPAGEGIALGTTTVFAERTIPIGHKIARRPIAVGEKIIKYGAPIGSATATIAAGAHVHVHNVESDYTPTYTLDEAHGQAP